MVLFLFIVTFPMLLTLILKVWMAARDSREPDLYKETDIEKHLNDIQANDRFEAAWNMVGTEELASRDNPKWGTPEELLLEEHLKRHREGWSQRLPGQSYDLASKRR